METKRQKNGKRQTSKQSDRQQKRQQDRNDRPGYPEAQNVKSLDDLSKSDKIFKIDTQLASSRVTFTILQLKKKEARNAFCADVPTSVQEWWEGKGSVGYFHLTVTNDPSLIQSLSLITHTDAHNKHPGT